MSSRLLFCGSRSARPARVFACCSTLFASLLATSPAHALPRTWIGGNVDWVDGGSTANWNPADEPDSDDEAIFNTANVVNLGSNNAVNGLTLSGGIDLLANEFDLTVDGLVQLTGAGTNLIIGNAAGSVLADDVAINGGVLELRGGTLNLDEEVGTSLLDLNAGGSLTGNGVVSFADAPLAFTTVFSNDGTLTALSRPAILFGAPPVGMLQINTANAFSLVDLDGAGNAGLVNVNRNQTLDVNGTLADAFGGAMTLAHEATLDISSAWSMNGGTLTANNGFVAGGLGVPDVPAGKSTIQGGALTQSGGTINVADADGTLQFDADFTMSGGTFTNSGKVVFNGAANFTNAASWAPANSGSSLEINDSMTVNDAAGNFNWDGPGTSSTTINGAGSLSLTVNQIDTGDNVYGGTLNLNDNGDVSVNNVANAWTLVNTLNKNNVGTSSVNGDALTVSSGATINVNGGTLDVNATLTLNGGANLVVDAGATALMAMTNVNANANITVDGTLSLGINSQINAPNPITGTGLFRLGSTSTIVGNTTVNTTSFDWDGTGSGTSHTINNGVVFTVNSSVWDPDDSGDVDDNINVGGSGAQVVVNNIANWTMARTLTTNTPDVGVATIGGTARMTLSGAQASFNVNGNTDATARITFGASSTTTIAAAGVLHLKGGSFVDVNEIAGGTIDGPGTLRAEAGRALQGFGTINAPIDFDGNAELHADNGTLTINGAILDVDQIGTADGDGTLHVTNAWNNNASTGVQLNGGVLSGGTITNDVVAGISGHGLVTARVINNTQLYASIGDKLVFETAGNNNDWDGTTNAGEIEAIAADVELRDNANFGFTGTVSVSNGHTALTNGFALDFNPGSTLTLANGGRYQSTVSTDFGGAVNVGAGGATIEVENNWFLTLASGSTTTLGSNLQLQNNNIIVKAGATFSGAGALVVPDGSHMVAENLANVGVLLDMQGALRPGNSQGIGRVDLFDYQQSNTSQLFIELVGTSLNAFDRLVASGDVVLDGFLSIDIDDISPGVPFVPSLGQTFNIITGNTVTGTFDTVDVSGMPEGLAFHLNYLSNALQLQVVNKPIYSADFDNDGDVDSTDYGIWDSAFDLNQLGDADGDNDSDGADFLLWQRQFGSVPAVAAAQPAGGAVPEPSGALLLLLATVGLCRRSRR